MMRIIGGDFLRSAMDSDGYYFKVLVNDSGAHFFPSTTEHRDATQPGLCYKDDSLGNALAGTIKPGRIDIRFHRAFSDAHVASVLRRLLDHADATPLAGFSVTYQGRSIDLT